MHCYSTFTRVPEAQLPVQNIRHLFFGFFLSLFAYLFIDKLAVSTTGIFLLLRFRNSGLFTSFRLEGHLSLPHFGELRQKADSFLLAFYLTLHIQTVSRSHWKLSFSDVCGDRKTTLMHLIGRVFRILWAPISVTNLA
jgi:hypothetical protein